MKQGGFWGLATLVVIGAIVADVLKHPKGTETVSRGLVRLVNSSLRAAAGQNVK